MSIFFSNFPQVLYNFGNEVDQNAFQNISAYVDVIDQAKNNSTLYTKHTILDGDRPDVLSQKLYGQPYYHWTFYLMNDKLRRQGWPLSYNEVVNKAKADYPNKTLVTRDLFFEKFKVGDTVTGINSAAKATVLRRNLDLGQIVVKPTNSYTFNDGELISDGTNQITLTSVSEEYNSAHHYEDGDKNVIDIDPEVGPGALLTEITHLNRYEAANDDLKEIIIIKPSNITEITRIYDQAMLGA